MAYNSLMDALKLRRQQMELSQAELADLAGMSAKTYGRLERGEVEMKMSQYRAIVDGLGITDLDVSLDMLNVRETTAWDVAAAARVLLPATRQRMVEAIMSEWRRTEKYLHAELNIKKGNGNK
ncbi:helix-turn-helix transcriptional regulator [Photobacterium leiognathi]|uniref:helix-turn-helix transcriptional regulator n=1 Tax=Photobacterium leiognathi TaxID=553611 RepID=UPI000D16033F|nr:helix-turn-helix transcriptional regulator [Photobacterium leiognathi]PSW53054.1 transcriptional regulator [Photobacterium leiognathi subsp. mandapamensis]